MVNQIPVISHLLTLGRLFSQPNNLACLSPLSIQRDPAPVQIHLCLNNLVPTGSLWGRYACVHRIDVVKAKATRPKSCMLLPFSCYFLPRGKLHLQAEERCAGDHYVCTGFFNTRFSGGHPGTCPWGRGRPTSWHLRTLCLFSEGQLH